MLSRVADSIYWMSRYVERAEHVARFVDVNLNLMLDSPSGAEQQWMPIINTTGDHETFESRYGAATQDNAIQFLAFDSGYGNSIISCLRAARENARSVREIISSEMWEQLNSFYLMVKEAASQPAEIESLHALFTAIKQSSHLFCGICDAIMSHGEGWHFAQMGRMLERADKTSRLLDVKYFILLRSISEVGTAFDDVQWIAVLRSASAFEMYRKTQGRVSPSGVVKFLLLDPDFPRSVRFCLDSARASLHAISGTPLGSFRNPPEKTLGHCCSDLAYITVDEIIKFGLHEYLDALQDTINLAGNGIHETFFARRVPASVAKHKQMMS